MALSAARGRNAKDTRDSMVTERTTTRESTDALDQEVTAVNPVMQPVEPRDVKVACATGLPQMPAYCTLRCAIVLLDGCTAPVMPVSKVPGGRHMSQGTPVRCHNYRGTAIEAQSGVRKAAVHAVCWGAPHGQRTRRAVERVVLHRPRRANALVADERRNP
jgi:hypothetical protein